MKFSGGWTLDDLNDHVTIAKDTELADAHKRPFLGVTASAASKTLTLGLDDGDMMILVNEGGTTFSGGQRQRLLIARSLVHHPRIIVFDEATSSLDNETQAIVSKTLEAMRATRIVVAHRLSTIENADRILVMERGEIVEDGTYSELMEKKGLFAELAARQIA